LFHWVLLEVELSNLIHSFEKKLQETPASVELIDVLVITLEMVFWGHCLQSLIKLEEKVQLLNPLIILSPMSTHYEDHLTVKTTSLLRPLLFLVTNVTLCCFWDLINKTKSFWLS